uniref:Uncharacterized protein n=1 Tax=Zea mays TaxID=4577 RepID=B6T2F3_MAIZE|nr:hypothetical protein [Zea mays]
MPGRELRHAVAHVVGSFPGVVSVSARGHESSEKASWYLESQVPGQEQVPQDEAHGGCCDEFVRCLGRRLPVNFGLLDRCLLIM